MELQREDQLLEPPRVLAMRFADSSVEALFRAQSSRTVWASSVLGLVLAMLTVAGFCYLDAVFLRETSALASAWTVRGAWLALAGAVLYVAIRRREWFDLHQRTLLFIVTLAGCIGVAALLGLAPYLAHHHGAFLLFLALGATAFRLHYLALAALGGLTLAAQLAAYGPGHLGSNALVTVSFALTLAATLGGAALAYHAERQERMDFRITRMVQRRAERLEQRAVTFQQLAETDALTGVLNRRRFLELAEREARRAARYKTPVAVLLIDLDRFKSVNDSYGHGIGDEVLKAFADVATSILRTSDVLGRTGGEEFAVVLPETRLREAAAAATRLREAVAALDIPTPSGPLRITVSIGVSILRETETTVEPALERADQALYAAKDAGRDCVVVNTDGRLRLVTGQDA